MALCGYGVRYQTQYGRQRDERDDWKLILLGAFFIGLIYLLDNTSKDDLSSIPDS